MENALLLDASVAVYALGAEDPRRGPCRRLLDRGGAGEFRLYASIEMIQEVVHHRLRKTGNRAHATADARDITAMCTTLAFDREILDLALDLIERGPNIRGRDAVHAATAIAYGIERIASTDPAFDGIPGITRLDPSAQYARVESGPCPPTSSTSSVTARYTIPTASSTGASPASG